MGTYEHVIAHIDAILRETGQQNNRDYMAYRLEYSAGRN